MASKLTYRYDLMLSELDHFYIKQDEPLRSAFLALRTIILSAHPDIQAAWKYKIPFFTLNGKNICYLWRDKQQHPYIGFPDGYRIVHPALESGDRKRIKVLHINPHQDFPLETITTIIAIVIAVHSSN